MAKSLLTAAFAAVALVAVASGSKGTSRMVALTVTLAGAPYRGCESVDIGRNGLPASVGRHERCVSAQALA